MKTSNMCVSIVWNYVERVFIAVVGLLV